MNIVGYVIHLRWLRARRLFILHK